MRGRSLGGGALRRKQEGNNVPIESSTLDQEMVAWAQKLIDCFYWMNASEPSEQSDFTMLDDVGGSFEALALALALVQELRQKRSGGQSVWERSLPLVAEAQSALREAFQRLRAPDLPEQLDAFEWLKSSAARHHVYIKRFMRAGDAADPARWSSLVSRIEATAGGGQLSRQQALEIEQLRDRLSRMQPAERTDHGWPAVVSTVDQLVRSGVPPSNRELRELLLPLLDSIPERGDVPESLKLVLREIDRFLATRSSDAKTPVAHEPSAEAGEVSRLLRGRCVVLIGGSRRREAQASLKKALGLSDLLWLETKEHQAVATFEPMIARPDVALVLLAIRWSSHAFGDVKQICDRYNKPLVRLPGGYSPNQVAAQIVAQSSGRLEQ